MQPNDGPILMLYIVQRCIALNTASFLQNLKLSCNSKFDKTGYINWPEGRFKQHQLFINQFITIFLDGAQKYEFWHLIWFTGIK